MSLVLRVMTFYGLQCGFFWNASFLKRIKVCISLLTSKGHRNLMWNNDSHSVSCKYPPCVDIVDITGRRLRTIDQDQFGNQLFEMPGYLGNLGGRIVVSDRSKKALICVDQLGEVVFNYTGEVRVRFS